MNIVEHGDKILEYIWPDNGLFVRKYLQSVLYRLK